MTIKSKRAAMEMSVGTMVTIVLLMVVLVLGIFFIQKIFSSATNAIDTVDKEVQSQIEKVFSQGDKKTAFYPTSRDVIVKKGDDPKGFGFAVRNPDTEDSTFTFTTTATDASKCGSTFDLEDAQDMLLVGSGSFDVGTGEISDVRIVKFVVPESAPPCTIGYSLKIKRNSGTHGDLNFFLIIK